MQHKLFIARRENRLKQKDVAEVLHIDPITYHRKESGKAAFTLPEAFKLAEYFGMKLDDLFMNAEKGGKKHANTR